MVNVKPGFTPINIAASAYAGPTMAYTKIPVTIEESTPGVKEKTIVEGNLVLLYGNANIADEAQRTRFRRGEEHFPQKEWSKYCGWLPQTLMEKISRVLVKSMLISPSKDQENELMQAVFNVTKSVKFKTAMIGKGANINTALSMRVNAKVPIMNFKENELAGALQFLGIKAATNPVDMVLEQLQGKIDDFNSKSKA